MNAVGKIDFEKITIDIGSTLSKAVAQGQYIKIVAGTAECGIREIKLALRQV